MVKKTMGICLLAYWLWMIFFVVRGLFIQIRMFVAPDFSIEYFMYTWGLYAASWLATIFYIISIYRAIRASMKYYNGDYLIRTGLIGILGYLITYFAYSIFMQRVCVQAYIIAPICIVAIGILCKLMGETEHPYEPMLSVLANSINRQHKLIVKWVCSSFLKLKQLQQSKKIQWSEEKNTSYQDDNSGES